jgi:hypothetical protein
MQSTERTSSRYCFCLEYLSEMNSYIPYKYKAICVVLRYFRPLRSLFVGLFRHGTDATSNDTLKQRHRLLFLAHKKTLEEEQGNLFKLKARKAASCCSLKRIYIVDFIQISSSHTNFYFSQQLPFLLLVLRGLFPDCHANDSMVPAYAIR